MNISAPLEILITGANGDSLPTPYGGIIKRCLLHAKEWKHLGANVRIHIHHKHDHEDDLGAGAQYFYDFNQPPTKSDKLKFVLTSVARHPILFTRLLGTLLWLWPERNASLLYHAAKGIRLEQEVRRARPDVIITEAGSPQSVCNVVIAQTHHIPLVLENYAEIQFKGANAEQNIAHRFARAWRFLVNHMDRVIPASTHCAKGPSAYLKDLSRIHIVYSGINFAIFSKQRMKSRAELRQSFGLPQDKFLIMAVGALRMRKGHDQLFESVLRLAPQDLANTGVVLCGMGPVDDMRRTAEELGFPKAALAVFQGLSEERLAELYASVDCFCFPSITPRECMGMALKEGMSVGLPVAAYNSGGISEAIEDGVNGYLAPTGDRQALADALTRLMQLPAHERDAMGQRNIDKARRLFDITKTAQELLTDLEQLAR